MPDAYWIFDETPASKRKTGGLPGNEIFKGIDSLVREALQNSKDQALKDGCAHVTFRIEELSGDALKQLLEAAGWPSLEPHVRGAEQSDSVTVSPRLAGGLQQVEDGRLRVLYIEDSGTAGLLGGEDVDANFTLLTKHDFMTGKTGGAGGSFGLGKSVLWAFSVLSTVLFFSELSEPEVQGRERFIGRAVFPAHETDEGSWDGSGWLGAPEGDPPKRAVSVWGDDAAQIADLCGMTRGAGPGTTIAILGFDHPSLGLDDDNSIVDLCQQIVEATQIYFWPALVDGTLEVNVTGVKDAVEVFPLTDVEAESDATLPFIKAKTGEVSESGTLEEPGDIIEIPIEVAVPAQRNSPWVDTPLDAHNAKAVLRIRKAFEEEKAFANTVACHRGVGMVVKYADNLTGLGGDGSIHAVLSAGTATGDSTPEQALEEFLRASEPVAHEDWTRDSDRIQASYGKGFVGAIKKFWSDAKTALRSVNRQVVEPADDVPKRVRQMFPLPGVDDSDNVERYRITHYDAKLDGQGWTFSVTVSRQDPEASGGWEAVVETSLDQAGDSTKFERLPVSKLESDEEKLEIVDPGDGRRLVVVPPHIDVIQLSGRSEAPSDMTADQISLVRLRLKIDGSSRA